MITKITLKEKDVVLGVSQTAEYEYRGLSTDNKPTGADNGSRFYEMDTGYWYLFDSTAHKWWKVDDLSRFKLEAHVISDTSITMGEMQAIVDELNAKGEYFLFDLTAFGANMFLVSMYLDGDYYRIADQVTGLERIGFTSADTPLIDVLNGETLGREHYTFAWDMALAKGTRLNDAASLPLDTTNFGHFGSVNANYDNPFDSIYPWSGRKLCNIDLDAYRALTSGQSLTECVKAWEGDDNFSYDDEMGVWVYTPSFYGRSFEAGGVRYFDITTEATAGNILYPEQIEGRWHGRAVTLTVDGANVTALVPTPGIPSTSIAMSTLHTYAKNWGAQLIDIYQLDADSLLMAVEYATLNSQNAVGLGVSGLYRQNAEDKILEAGTDVNYVIVGSALAAYCDVGAILDIGTSSGAKNVGSFEVVSKEASGSNFKITIDGTVTVTTDHFVSIHGHANSKDEAIGSKSGYIGTNGRVIAYYRGAELFSNMFQYILGAYWEHGTGHIWIADRGDCNNYDALDTTKHTDTRCVVPSGASGYVKSLGVCSGLSLPPFCIEIGGNSTNPVGDYCYAQAHSYEYDRVLFLGGHANNGAYGGLFYGTWHYGSGSSDWNCGARPSLVTP